MPGNVTLLIKIGTAPRSLCWAYLTEISGLESLICGLIQFILLEVSSVDLRAPVTDQLFPLW